jgi:hypothetical protein
MSARGQEVKTASNPSPMSTELRRSSQTHPLVLAYFTDDTIGFGRTFRRSEQLVYVSEKVTGSKLLLLHR